MGGPLNADPWGKWRSEARENGQERTLDIAASIFAANGGSQKAMVREKCPCLQLSDSEAGIDAGKRLAPWKTKGNGLITYISRGGENEEVKALNISARGSMSKTGVALTGWFTKCCRKEFHKEGRVVTWKSNWETRLQEMKLILEGFKTLMDLFGEKEVVAYFRHDSLPAFHVHVHAVAASGYSKESGDERLEDIIPSTQIAKFI